MKPTPKGWWYGASVEQRLAQVDGGIECGMTAKQIAMNCGAGIYHERDSGVSAFARKHGRYFGSDNAHKGNVTTRAREGARVFHAKTKLDMTDYHFNIFALGEVSKPASEFEELDFQS